MSRRWDDLNDHERIERLAKVAAAFILITPFIIMAIVVLIVEAVST